jgi:hypothetical protein
MYYNIGLAADTYLPARNALLARENSPIDGAAATLHAPAEV